MAIYVSAVRLRNVRSFGAELKLDLSRGATDESSTARLHTILIGENGTGKTTLLRAIAVGLADEKDAGGLLAEATGQFVAEGQLNATIDITVRDSGETYHTETVIRSDRGQDVLETKTPRELRNDALVCGYGIIRFEGGAATARTYRLIDSVYSLFNYADELISTELALRRLRDFRDEAWFQSVMHKIQEALGLPSGAEIKFPRGGGVIVSGPGIGNAIPLEGWADGYRRTLAWIVDFYHWAMRADCISPEGDVSGIVLVDELEQHLHPSMQIAMPSRLRNLFPHVQLIATTHSPLIALGAAPNELVVLKRDGDNILAHESVRDFHGYSVEDMLADSELFDSNVYSPDVSEKLSAYRELAQKPETARSAGEESELRRLGADLMALGSPTAGESPVLEELRAILDKHGL